MNVKLIKLTSEYKDQLGEMIDEWKHDQVVNHTDRSPYAIFKNDYHDFDNYLKNLDFKKPEDGHVPTTTFFLLDVDKEILLERITGRRLCKSCGRVYNVNIESLRPIEENVCDKCKTELTQRSDDNADTFNVRYNEYLEQTSPLIEYYQNKHILYKIDSIGTIDEIFNQIKNIINN